MTYWGGICPLKTSEAGSFLVQWVVIRDISISAHEDGHPSLVQLMGGKIHFPPGVAPSPSHHFSVFLAEGMAEAVSSSRDCLQAGESCTNDPICSAKFRTLRQCIAGNGANKLGPDAKNQCRSTVTALLSSQLYGCKCKRGMKKEKHCLSVYWSIHHTLMEGQLSRVLISDDLPKRELLLGLSTELPSTKVAAKKGHPCSIPFPLKTY